MEENTKNELILQYLSNKDEIIRLNKDNSKILIDLRETFDHKIGEIATWMEKGREEYLGGRFWNPKFKPLPDKLRTLVLKGISVSIDIVESCRLPILKFNLEFKSINKKGNLSDGIIYLHSEDVNWTGSIYEESK